MFSEFIHITKKNMTPPPPVGAPNEGEAKRQGREAGQLDVTPNQKLMDTLVFDVENSLKLIHDVDMRFSVHEESGRVMITVTDSSTGKLVREIPRLNCSTWP